MERRKVTTRNKQVVIGILSAITLKSVNLQDFPLLLWEGRLLREAVAYKLPYSSIKIRQGA
jgi:hypothetical protein